MFKKISVFIKKLFLNDNGKFKYSPLFIVALVLALTVPTCLALSFAMFYTPSGEKEQEIEIWLYDSNGKLLLSETATSSNIEKSSIAKLFYNKTEVSLPDGDIEFSENFKCTIKDENGTTDYICHFTNSAQSSYIKTDLGLFKPDIDCYTDFLNSDFSELLYPNSNPPSLSTADGEIIIPSAADWNYKKENGKFTKATKCSLTSSNITYRMTAAINISFAKAPDSCSVQLFDKSNKEIYNGSIDNLADFTVDIGENITAAISAEWKNKANSDFYGKATYNFGITIGSRVEFYSNREQLSAGEFLVISTENAFDLNKISYHPKEDYRSSYTAEQKEATIENALNKLYEYKPAFVNNGDVAYAIIPFDANLPQGSFSFSLSCGASEKTFSVKINKLDQSIHTSFNKAENELSDILSDESLYNFYYALGSITNNSSSSILSSTQFASPNTDNFSLGYSFFDKVPFKNAVIADDSFEALGNEYLSAENSNASVLALGSGIITKAEYCEYLGNYVVIDHGMGLKTWYASLSYCTVAEGDIVKKGDSVGSCGSGGLISANGFVLMCTVYDTFVNPEFIFGMKLI